MSDEPAKRRLTPRRAVLAAVLLGALVLAAPFASPQVRSRAHVWWLLRGIHSKDPAVREEARQRILALGRPAMDSAYPELVAQAVEEACASNEFDANALVVFVGTAETRFEPTNPSYKGHRVSTFKTSPLGFLLGSVSAKMIGAIPYPSKKPILLGKVGWRDEEHIVMPTELIVGWQRGAPFESGFVDPPERHVQVLVSAPLDDDLAPAVTLCVKETISRLPSEISCHNCGGKRVRGKGSCPQCGF